MHIRANTRPLAVAATVMLVGGTACMPEAQVFDSMAWKAAAGCRDDNARARMVTLLQTDILSPPPSEIVLLERLGKPEQRKGKLLSYCLGTDRPDTDFYVIVLDEKGVVANHYREQG
ncbi:MAG: hypothetical protein ACFB6R_06685 [Alphaproteobacteria bacterium]